MVYGEREHARDPGNGRVQKIDVCVSKCVIAHNSLLDCFLISRERKKGTKADH